jgi:AcrR family transcriptional regulator
VTTPAESPATRDLILNAAQRLFARTGLEATTIKAIGTESGLNPALIYYYFGNKELLYRAVLTRIGEALISRGGAALQQAPTPLDAIRALVQAQAEFLRTHPDAPKLIVRELIDHDARHAEALILQVAAGIFHRLTAAIEAGQQSGIFRTDIEPRFAAVSTVAQVVYFTLARPAIGVFMGQGTGGVTDEVTAAFGRHAADFAISALSREVRPA